MVPHSSLNRTVVDLLHRLMVSEVLTDPPADRTICDQPIQNDLGCDHDELDRYQNAATTQEKGPANHQFWVSAVDTLIKG